MKKQLQSKNRQRWSESIPALVRYQQTWLRIIFSLKRPLVEIFLPVLASITMNIFPDFFTLAGILYSPLTHQNMVHKSTPLPKKIDT